MTGTGHVSEDAAATHDVNTCCKPCCAQCPDPEAIHGWFSLTYADYLVIPRSHLQSMPNGWQARFVALLDEWTATAGANGWKSADGYRVHALTPEGKFTKDTAPHYERGRTRLPIARIHDPSGL